MKFSSLASFCLVDVEIAALFPFFSNFLFFIFLSLSLPLSLALSCFPFSLFLLFFFLFFCFTLVRLFFTTANSVNVTVNITRGWLDFQRSRTLRSPKVLVKCTLYRPLSPSPPPLHLPSPLSSETTSQTRLSQIFSITAFTSIAYIRNQPSSRTAVLRANDHRLERLFLRFV